MKNVFFNWGVADHYGWGVYGLNLLVHGLLQGQFNPVPLQWPPKFLYPVDPFTQKLLDKARSSWADGISARDGDCMLSGVGNQIKRQSVTKKMREVAVIFFEHNPLPALEIEKLKQFDLVITGSSWNQNALETMGVRNQRIIQGCDTDLFRWQPKKIYKDRFVIFSGGKLEFRKGQDILLRAFSLFSSKYDDALLVTAWRSPWEEQIAHTMNYSENSPRFEKKLNFETSLANWVADFGIDAAKCIHLNAVSNRLMPEVFREVDLAVFPNRCEGGTNLVAMEAMSAGVLCALSANTGHNDLIQKNNCVPLNHQSSIELKDQATEGWGESSVEELLATMEAAYQRANGYRPDIIADSVAAYTWQSAIEKIGMHLVN